MQPRKTSYACKKTKNDSKKKREKKINLLLAQLWSSRIVILQVKTLIMVSNINRWFRDIKNV